MALSIVSPPNSFIQFAESDTVSNCGKNPLKPCLPVIQDDDIAFQFIIKADSTGEADLLCSRADPELIIIGLTEECGDALEGLIVLPGAFQISRISPTQVLYNWPHGLPDFRTVISEGDCFHIFIATNQYGNTYVWCSNCLQRITDDCMTSVVDYSGNSDAFGFDYCGGTPVDDNEEDICEPTLVGFNNVPNISIPYTAQLLAKYGNVPTVSTWIYDETGELVQMGIRETLDGIPPATIKVDFGGVSSGIIKIS